MSVDYRKIFWPLLHNKIRRGVKNHTFGMVRKYKNGVAKPHQGWDFEATTGTPFYAIGSGKVQFVRSNGDYGLQLCHSFEFKGQILYAFYAHLERTYVHQGDSISGNQELGTTGETGNARGAPKADQHLHFEIRTTVTPRSSLLDRIDPSVVFGHCPLTIGVAG